ncbi:MAG: sigma-70 family RNA polymerase sigma factor [Paludibaculum sp.]
MDEINGRPAIAAARAEFEKLVKEIRPELHRYCARMTGSVIDGEDVVQDTLAKAFYLLPQTQGIANLRSWLFRIAHNKAIDYTRSYARRFGEALEEHHELAAEATPVEAQETAKLGLSLFMKLTPPQRGAVILKDVLGHSLAEIAEILETSVPAIKGALNRGRTTLQRLGPSMEDGGPPLDRSESLLLENYVAHFAARDFDRLRALLAEDVRLDVVGVAQNRGAVQVGELLPPLRRTLRLAGSEGRGGGAPRDSGHESRADIRDPGLLRAHRLGGRPRRPDPRLPVCALCDDGREVRRHLGAPAARDLSMEDQESRCADG